MTTENPEAFDPNRLMNDYPDWGTASGCKALVQRAYELGRAELQRLSAPPVRHVGECADDPIARDVCEGMYADRLDDNIALCEALRAVYAFAGQNKEIAKIVHDAIREHGALGENT